MIINTFYYLQSYFIVIFGTSRAVSRCTRMIDTAQHQVFTDFTVLKVCTLTLMPFTVKIMVAHIRSLLSTQRKAAALRTATQTAPFLLILSSLHEP